MEFKTMFSPIKIGNVEIKNRFVMPPMDSGIPEYDGTCNQNTADYYAARAKGGFGLIIMEYSFVDPKGQANVRTVGVWDDKFIPGLAKVAAEVHKYDKAKIFMQLHHAGRQGSSLLTGFPVEAPSPLSCRVCRQLPKELTTEEVYELIEKFGDAAVRAQKAGFDGVEIHAGHGYLVNQFMSSYSNKRFDEFGGNFKARMLFPKLIIRNIKRKVGNGFPITMRISVDEFVNAGRDIIESKVACAYLQDVGLDAIHCTVGVYGSKLSAIATNQVGPAPYIHLFKQIKDSVHIPVIGGVRIDPYYAEQIVSEGMVDLLFFGRQSLADPEFPNKMASGNFDEIRPCIVCMDKCTRHVYVNPEEPINCTMNPFCGREGTMKIEKAKDPKKVVVVGAGPAGLEAASIAAERGHKVTVYEKSDKIGGQFKFAAVPPYKENLLKALKYWGVMCAKYGVDIRYNTEASSDMILAESPDVVILATGGIPIRPAIPGMDSPKVIDAVDLLGGKFLAEGNILILGGGEVGLETADFLAERFNKVSVIDMLSEVGKEIPIDIKPVLFKRLFEEYGVNLMTSCCIKVILEDGVTFEKDGKEETITGFTAIINALGAKAYNPLEADLQNKVKELYVIGDAQKARNAIEAIDEAAKLAIVI